MADEVKGIPMPKQMMIANLIDENQRLRSALKVMMDRYRYVWGQCEDEPEYKQAKAALDGEVNNG